MLTGFAYAPETSMTVVLASLPIMIIHTLAVSLSTYKLVRRVQSQNLQLQQFSRTDALTGLGSRHHWESQAEALLKKHHAEGVAATLMLIDIDRFKEVNDRYGHAVGDDVLREIAALTRKHVATEGHGRLGGDEFVVVLPLGIDAAMGAAERVRNAVEQLQFQRVPGLRSSLSIGLAQAPDGNLGLREWIEAADRALYRAKNAGRNRTSAGDSPPSEALVEPKPAAV